MKHKVVTLKSPDHKVEIFRCSQCAIKVMKATNFLEQDCVPSVISKREITYFQKGYIFGTGGVKHIN